MSAPGVLGNDSDPDSNPLTAQLVSDAANGALLLGGDGSVSYMPAADFSGMDHFSYVANDGVLNSQVTTVTIEVRLPEPGTFDITKAVWLAKRSWLRVEGNQAPQGVRVTIKNAGSGETLGTILVASNGRWRFDVFDLVEVPCRVEVKIQGQVVERDVDGAPQTCRR